MPSIKIAVSPRINVKVRQLTLPNQRYKGKPVERFFNQKKITSYDLMLITLGRITSKIKNVKSAIMSTALAKERHYHRLGDNKSRNSDVIQKACVDWHKKGKELIAKQEQLDVKLNGLYDKLDSLLYGSSK